VADACGCTMGIDVADLARSKAGIHERGTHRAHLAVGIWLRNVAGVGGVAVARDLRIDPRSALTRPIGALEHESGGTFTEHDPSAVRREGFTTAGRIDRV